MTAQTYAVPLLSFRRRSMRFMSSTSAEEQSVRFLLEEGFSVFMISWKNPDASMEAITFEDYMTDGPRAASDVCEITGAERINPVGYCIGRTLLAMTLAYLAARRDERFGAATFMVSLLDFSEVGDMAVFIDEPQIAYMEQQMLERGYLDSRRMSDMFNLLRANDLIWNMVINDYLMGNKPAAFDLLYGTTTAPEWPGGHSLYVRNTFLENNLITAGKISLLGQEIDLRRIHQDIYAVGAERTTSCPGARPGGLRSCKRADPLVLAASGHIAGMLDPPSKGKGGYWTNDILSAPANADAGWPARKSMTAAGGPIWPVGWDPVRGENTRAAVGSAAHPPIGDAPGT